MTRHYVQLERVDSPGKPSERVHVARVPTMGDLLFDREDQVWQVTDVLLRINPENQDPEAIVRVRA